MIGENMTVEKINRLLAEKDFDGIWKYLSEQKDAHYDEWSKDEKLYYWLSLLERKSFSESGKHGILGETGNFQEAELIFDTFKKLCQRLEWWPDMDPETLVTYMTSNSITPQELLWVINSYALDSEYVMGRIRGIYESRDLFYRDDEAVLKTKKKWNDRYADVGGQKICFIACCNNDRERDEMNVWIDRLWIPEGMEVEKREVTNAPSMCAGYNEAMNSSDAKYKIYLHQDIRILNPYFIYDLIDCFDRNPKAGMVGMFGAETVPESGVMWQARRFGAVVHSEFSRERIAETFDEKVAFEKDFKAALTDGFLIATRVDIKWREDIFKGWDFYDASQSMEFTSRGYEIVIPVQKVTWCLHDFGQINWIGYEENRQRFVETYMNKQNGEKMENVKDKISKFICAGEYDEAYRTLIGNLKTEVQNLKGDAEYCVLAATACMQNDDYQRAFDIMTIGLLADNKNYELYLMLGEYYARTNLNQALLCFFQALLYCEVEDDRIIIDDYITGVVEQGASIRQVSIVIVNKNQSEYLKRCLDSIVSTLLPAMYEIIVVDNGSSDGTDKWMSEIDGLTYCYFDEDLGYTKACNQGIKLADPHNDILLIDADARLIENTLFYLMLGLYSDDNVGVVGGITNDFILRQKMKLSSNIFDEALKEANTINCPMTDAYEKTVYVSDHAMLVGRKALDRVGMLDDSFSPDQYEDTDFCVRVNMAGLAVLLCMNSFVFKFIDRHLLYGDKKDSSLRNKEIFIKKWGCNIDYSTRARNELISFIKADRDKPIEVLELGCSMGSTLNRIKRKWPNSQVHGIEYVDSVARIAGSITDVIQGDVENMDITYSPKQFDYIFCADVLEHLRDPEGTLKRFMPYLKDDGRFIISLPNVRHYSVSLSLALWGRFDYGDEGILDRTHLRFFTLPTAREMIEHSGLKILEVQKNYNGHPEDNDYITKLKECFNVEDPDELKVFQYFFVASK